MATDLTFIEYLIEQLGNNNVRYQKMFGEFMVYYNEKPLFLICDNTCFVKRLSALERLLSTTGFPYKEAKEHFIIDIDDRELLQKVALILDKEIPLKKKK